jgi:hypothetical protein
LCPCSLRSTSEKLSQRLPCQETRPSISRNRCNSIPPAADLVVGTKYLLAIISLYFVCTKHLTVPKYGDGRVGLSLQAGGCHRTCVKGQSCLRRSGRSRLRQNASDFHRIYMVSYSAAQAAGGVRETRGEVYSRSMLYRQWFGHCPNLAVAWPDGYFSQSAYCECKWVQIGSAGEKPGLGSIIAGCRFAHWSCTL